MSAWLSDGPRGAVTAYRAPLCTRCGHPACAHYNGEHACTARGCSCPRWNARPAELPTPVRTVAEPADRDGAR